MKITRIKIVDYRGISELIVSPGAAGAIVSGANGRGKTSVLRALQAALNAEGVGPETIRQGADKAEILVDLDQLRVRRSITKKTSTVSVATEDGAKYPQPQTRLNELLGATLDPLAFYLAKPTERRRLILDAVPLRVTQAQIDRWCAGAAELGYSVAMGGLESASGLEVVDRLRREFYDKRTEANAAAKAAKARASEVAEAPEPDGPPVEEAERALAAADTALERLQVQRAGAEGARRATAGARVRAANLRERAGRLLAEAPSPASAAESQVATDRLDAAMRLVAEMKAKLEAAEAEMRGAQASVRAIDQRQKESDRSVEEATKLTVEADEIEASLSDVDSMDVPEVDLLTAAQVLDDAKRARDAAMAASQVRAANARARALRAEADEAAKRADVLDEIVTTLAETAPAELAESPGMIPGLGFSGDAITLDGVAIDDLCGAEQLTLAVEIARRANAKAKILVVDGLERLDPAGMEEFVRAATRDGWQLLATRVTSGDLVVEAIENEEGQAGQPGAPAPARVKRQLRVLDGEGQPLLLPVGEKREP